MHTGSIWHLYTYNVHVLPISMYTLVGWLVVLGINVDLAIFQPYLDLEAGDNQSLKIQVARRGIEPRSSCSASQELNHSATAAPKYTLVKVKNDKVDRILLCTCTVLCYKMYILEYIHIVQEQEKSFDIERHSKWIHSRI